MILCRAAAINDDPYENSSENAQYRCKRQIGILLFRRMRCCSPCWSAIAALSSGINLIRQKQSRPTAARKMACRLRRFALCFLSLSPRPRFGPTVIFNPSPLSQIERITGRDAEEVQMKSTPFKKRKSAEPRSALSSVFLRFFIQLKIKQNSIGGIGNAVSHPVHLQNLFANGEAEPGASGRPLAR